VPCSGIGETALRTTASATSASTSAKATRHRQITARRISSPPAAGPARAVSNVAFKQRGAHGRLASIANTMAPCSIRPGCQPATQCARCQCSRAGGQR
jgi:hypothetical protein